MAATKTKKAKAAKPVTFYSRSPNLRLVFEPEDIQRNERGRVTDRFAARDVQFEKGMYVWDPQKDDEEILDWLREHPKLNSTRESAFWEKGNAPNEARPTLAERQLAITTAAVAKDADALNEIIEDERETHNRDSVIDLATVALEQVTGEGSDSEPSPAPEQAS